MQKNNENLHPVLADYAKDIFIGLGFSNKILFYGMNTFSRFPFCLFCLISSYEATCQLLCKFLVVRWTFLEFSFLWKSYFYGILLIASFYCQR